MRHRFLLGNTGSTGWAPIKYEVHFGGSRFVSGTGVKILPELWDLKQMAIVKDKTILKEYRSQVDDLSFRLDQVEKRLQSIKNEVNAYLSQCSIMDDTPDIVELRRRIKENVISKGKISREDSNSQEQIIPKSGKIIDYLDRFIKLAERGTRTISFGKSKGKKFTEGTIKNYKGFFGVLKQFQIEIGHDLTWQEVSMKTYNDFLNFCNSRKFSQNYTGRHIKQFKAIAREARYEGLHNNEVFDDKKFATLTSPSDNIYLTSAELSRLEKLDLSGKSKVYEQVRDIFLAGCYTAQRWSDYSKMHLGQVVEKQLTLIQKKGNHKVVIPVKSELRAILQKYPQGFPKLAEQTFNEKIKIVGQLAGIDALIEKRISKGGEFEVKKYKKFELISSHTARRTGATLMYLEKVPSMAIMKITGHETESAFLKYIKSSAEETATMLQDFDFFK